MTDRQLKDADFKNLMKFTSLDEEEVEVLAVIYSLNKAGKPSGEEEVRAEVSKVFGEDEIKGLKYELGKLAEEKILTLDGDQYKVDLERIHNKLFDREEEFLVNIEGVRELQQHLEDILGNPEALTEKPNIIYMPLGQIEGEVTARLADASKCYIVANFPDILRTEVISEGMNPGRKAYIETLKKRLAGDDFELVILTRLGVDQPFKELLDALGDAAKARGTLAGMIADLAVTVKKYPNLKVYYLTNPFGLDGKLVIKDEPDEFFLLIRDPHRDAVGGIHIHSAQVGSQVKQIYDDTIKTATQVTADNVDGLVEKMKASVDRLYEKIKAE